MHRYLQDKWADTDKHFPGDPWEDTEDGVSLHGSLKQLYLLKKKHHSLKTMLSIGGWNASSSYNEIVKDESKINNFAKTAVALMTNLGFDGLNLDWESIKTTLEGTQFVDLLKAVRTLMDEYAKSTNSKPFLLSAAVMANTEHAKLMDLSAMDKLLDFWDFMAYDYAGSWDGEHTGHSSNLFPDPKNPNSTLFNTEVAMNYYLSKIDASKVNLGLPLYGHVFEESQGLGKSYNKQETIEKWTEEAVCNYKDCPATGKVVELPELGASYSIDESTGLIISYDTPNIVRQKAKWIKEKGLGGAMWWQADGDKKGGDSLVATVIKELGKLEKSKNQLNFPHSQYENIKNGMKGEGEEVHAQDEETKEDEVVKHGPQKTEENKKTTAEVGPPTSTSATSSTSISSLTSIPAPATTQPEIVAETTAPAMTTAVSTPAHSTFYSAFAEPTLTITQSEPVSENIVDGDEEADVDTDEEVDEEADVDIGEEVDEEDVDDEEEDSNGDRLQKMEGGIVKKTKKSDKKSASNAGPSAPKLGLVAGLILFFLL